ncbi:MAG: PorT family protein [Fibromonadales bacterium]|nr:PorT family protein [Fibromonadales bacterium]
MNKTTKIATLLIALAAVFCFSQEQENEIRFGARVASNASFVLGRSDGIGEIGYGLAIGAVASIPITSIVTFNPELNLIYRRPLVATVPKVYYYSPWGGVSYDYERVDVTEFAISIPALFQLMPFGGPVFYLEAGIQLDIPFATNEAEDIYGKYPDRAAFDFGIPFGLGWHIGKHFVLDSRISVGLTSIGKREKDFSLVSEEFGLLYLF